MPPTLADRILGRAARAGLTMSAGTAAAAAAYLDLLARWNRTINLTGLSVDPASDDVIDRLVVEGAAAAGHLRPGDARVIDIGSGGGSPAIPFRLAAATAPHVTLVEVKSRKAAFLREAVRRLALGGVEVANDDAMALARDPHRRGSADVVTVRAVKIDRRLARVIADLLAPGGRLFSFTAGLPAIDPELLTAAGLQVAAAYQLVPGGAVLAIAEKTRA